MRLSQVEVGNKVHLEGIDAGRGLQARLAAMGLTPGVQIEVVRNAGFGPFIIAVKDTRLVLGRGMADKVLIRQAETE